MSTLCCKCDAAVQQIAVAAPALTNRQPPGGRQIVCRHVIIEVAATRAVSVDALGNPERRRAAEHRTAAVAADAAWSPHRHPGGLARPATQRPWRRVIGELDFRAAV